MDTKEGVASTPPAGEPAAQSEPQDPAVAQPAQEAEAVEKPKMSQLQKPGEKKSLKARWQEAKALREAAKKDSKQDGHILKNFAVCALPWWTSL
jgi:hypothetical protein